jgi:hypothetical protein
MRIEKFKSYEPVSPNDFCVWIDMDQVQAVAQTRDGANDVTYVFIIDQGTLRVTDKAEEVVAKWLPKETT